MSGVWQTGFLTRTRYVVKDWWYIHVVADITNPGFGALRFESSGARLADGAQTQCISDGRRILLHDYQNDRIADENGRVVQMFAM